MRDCLRATIVAMKFPRALLLCCLVVLIAACSTSKCKYSAPPSAPLPPPAASASTAPAPAPLLLISIDGFRADYLERGLSPTLQMLAQQGVHADAMQPSFPSLTFPNHYTLVTGLTPDHHGIVNNTMTDPVLGKFVYKDHSAASDGRWWAGGTPIWETAEAHGLRTASMFWPGSEADIHGHHPDYWRPFDGKFPPEQRVDQVLSWLDLPYAQRPRFMTLYFDAVDHAGHEHGPDSPEVNAAIRATDGAIARLVDGLKQRGLYGHINIIVVADHGMAGVAPDHNILIDRLLPLKQVETVDLGVLAGFNPKPGHDFARIEARMTRPQQHMQCWDKSQVPARLGYGSHPRVPQLLCLADVGWRITSRDGMAKHKESPHLGEHGYDNADPLMRALFIASGPSFEQGLRVPEFPNVDVYPLMTHLLGIPAVPGDGDYDAVKQMLKPELR